MIPSSPKQSTSFSPFDNNSDPVFESPWEAKVFAIVNQLTSTHHYSWSEWTDQLAHEISAAERDAADNRSYYERWVSACEKLLIAKGLLDSQAIDEKVEVLLAERETDHTH